MYKNKHINNKNNICGLNIAKIRKEMTPRISQRALADKLQLIGLDLDKNAIQRIECGKRFVTDIELLAFSKILNISANELLRYETTTQNN